MRILLSSVVCVLMSLSGYAAEKVLYDFNDPKAKSLNWVKEYKDNPELSVEPENTTSNNFQLKMILKGGPWPGFTLPVPKDWSAYQAFRFEAYSAGPVTLTVRVDDPGSKDYHSRFHHTFKLKAGRNLCQIEVKNVAAKLNIKQIKGAVLFSNKPPNGLVVKIDNIVLGDIQGEDIPFIPYKDRRDLQPKSDVVTPHFPVGKPLAGGPLKTFFLTSITQGREVVEMMQRMDIKPSVQHWDVAYGRNTWGMGDFYGKRGHKTDYLLMQEYLASSMQGPETFDSIMLFTPQGWERYGKSAQDAIVKRVKEDGVGLVFVFPYPGVEDGKWPENLRSINALIDSESDFPRSNGYVRWAKRGRIQGKQWELGESHPITRGVPIQALPFEKMEYQQYKVAPGAKVLIKSETGDPILAVRQVGKGRVATFAWRSEGLTPRLKRGGGDGPLRPYRYWEVIYSLLNRASLWVAGRDMKAGSSTASLSDEYELNLKATVHKDAKGNVTDWALNFTPPGSATVKTLNVKAPDFINAGETLRVELADDAAVKNILMDNAGATVQIALTEQSLGKKRTLYKKSLTNETSVTFATDKVTQIMAVAEVEIRLAGKLIAIGKSETIVTPDKPAWEDYEVLMWHVGGLPFMRDLEDNMVTQFGSTGIMETGWRNEGLRMRYARAGLRLMVHDLARPQLQLREFPNFSQQYNKTKDKKLLIRNPSYADSKFLKAERDRVTKAVQELKKFHPTNYILCDEPSITYYKHDFDFDFHPENITRFRKALETKFIDLKTLNAALGTSYASFAAIYPPTSEEARSKKLWPIWNEWRDHNDNIMAAGYKMYKEAVEAADPKGTISLSGTQVATPFDGFDWAKLSPLFGSMQGYGYGDQERKRMSFAQGPMINAVPAGYGRSGRAVDFQIWDSVTNHGGGHVLFWWIAFRNPDLTFCQSAYDYMKLFKEMKSGIGRQFLLAKRELSPIAIQYSMNSIRAAYAFGGDFHKATDEASKGLVALGYDPIYMSDEEIANGELNKRGIKALYMPASYSLDSRLPAALKSFVNQGGKVFHTPVSSVNEYLRPAKADMSFATSYKTVDETAAALQSVVKPAVALSGNSTEVLKKLKIKVHTIDGKPNARMVTVLRPPVGTKEVLGGDGVIHMVPDDSGGKAVESVSVNLAGLNPKHVYEQRTGKKLNLKNGSLSLSMQAGDGTPLVLLPYAVNTVDVIVNTTPSGDIALKWQLVGSDSYARHAMRISVLENSKEDPVLSANATSSLKGDGSHVIRLAHEDKGRQLSIVIKDVLTGVKSKAMDIAL